MNIPATAQNEGIFPRGCSADTWSSCQAHGRQPHPESGEWKEARGIIKVSATSLGRAKNYPENKARRMRGRRRKGTVRATTLSLDGRTCVMKPISRHMTGSDHVSSMMWKITVRSPPPAALPCRGQCPSQARRLGFHGFPRPH